MLEEGETEISKSQFLEFMGISRYKDPEEQVELLSCVFDRLVKSKSVGMTILDWRRFLGYELPVEKGVKIERPKIKTLDLNLENNPYDPLKA